MNPYRIPPAEEEIDGYETHVVRGEARMRLNWRISMAEGRVNLWVIGVKSLGFFGRYETNDKDHSWIRVCSWPPEMPFVESCAFGIIALWFEWGCTEPLPHTEIADLCLGVTMVEADEDNKQWDRERTADLANALAAR